MGAQLNNQNLIIILFNELLSTLTLIQDLQVLNESHYFYIL